MDALLKALTDLVDNWGWLIILIGLPSLGDAIGRWRSGRRAIAKLKVENKALKREIERANDVIDKTVANSGATVITDPRHEALLWRVQATDTAVPQLPQGLRDDIDAALERAEIGGDKR